MTKQETQERFMEMTRANCSDDDIKFPMKIQARDGTWIEGHFDGYLADLSNSLQLDGQFYPTEDL